MIALSLWQPHAIAIGKGLKIYETRGWAASYRGPLAIHAAKKEFRERDYPWEWFKEARDRLRAAGVLLRELDYGKVVCVADLVDCVPTKDARHAMALDLAAGRPVDYGFWGDFSDVGEDGKPRWALKLENVRLIPKLQRPEVVGRQGFFEVDNEIGLWYS